MVATAHGPGLALLCGVLALGVASAGCTVQDRPPNEAFFVVADAGAAQIFAPGGAAHLSFPENQTIEAEKGAPPLEEVAYAWTASWGTTSNHSQFHAMPPGFGLSLVELNVTAKNHTASDAVGLLVVPPGSAGPGQVQIGIVGEAQLSDLAPSPALTKVEVRAGAHGGTSYGAALPGSGPSSYRLVPRGGASAPEFVVLIAVKSAGGTLYSNTSLPLRLDSALNNTLVVDSTAAQQHRIEVRDGSGALLESLSLDAFGAAHPGQAESRVLVSPPGQSLPGFEGAAAAGAFLCVGLLALWRRR